MASSLIDDIVNTDKTQLDYIGENGTSLIILIRSLYRLVLLLRTRYARDLAVKAEKELLLEKIISLIKKLINAGADLNIHSHKFIKNMTAVSFAIVNIHQAGSRALRWFPLYDKIFSIITLLLDKGADLNVIDDTGRTALDWIQWYRLSDLAGDLIAKGALTRTQVESITKERNANAASKLVKTANVARNLENPSFAISNWRGRGGATRGGYRRKTRKSVKHPRR
jgi:hypothetical protein